MITENMNCLNGFYSVNNEIITSKVFALLKATELKSEVTWNYFDGIFANTALNFNLHTATLESLYITRAQQLRDTYDYLILNYSGGSDSHNILHTFLKNKIKLDHIFVQWPEQLTDRGIYTPNTIDKSNANFHSEWDFVLKKDLEWIGNHHPEIKIEIADWTTTVTEEFYKDDLFSKDVSNLPSIARAQKQNTFSLVEGTLALAGKKVASIYGIDKPNIVKKDNEWFFYFVDTACMAQPNSENPLGTEYFYWSPQCPTIAVAQAYKMIEWFKLHPHKQYLILAKSERTKEDPAFNNWPYSRHYSEWAETQEIAKLVCYPYWDFNRFQADKPFSKFEGFNMGTRAWDNILTVLPSFSRSQQAWEYHWLSYLQKIDPKLMRSKDTVGVLKSKWHLLR